MDEELANSAVELNAIFDNMSPDLILRIPKKVFEYYNNIASKTYEFSYDTSKSLNEQNISETTKDILIKLYDEYIYDKEESRRLERLEEMEKSAKYNVSVFADTSEKSISIEQESEIEQDSIKGKELVKEEKIGFLKRLIEKLKFWKTT